MERQKSIKQRHIHLAKKPFAERAKEHCRQFTAFMFSNVGIIILVVLYMIGGASIFKVIEGTVNCKWAKERNESMAMLRGNLTNQLWDITLRLNNFNRSSYLSEIDEKISEYQQKIVLAANDGWIGANSTTYQTWTFSNALLYSLTVITTIGYGNITPRTISGKFLTIAYAVIGMPLFLLYLSNIGDIMAKSFKWIYAKVCLCRICPGVAKRREARTRYKIRALERRVNNEYPEEEDFDSEIENNGSVSSSSSSSKQAGKVPEVDDTTSSSSESASDDFSTVTVPISVCLMIMISYIVFGAIIFGANWSKVLTGCYFCFISLSSIGFGDVVPGDKIFKLKGNGAENTSGVDVQFIICAVYLLLGMALIAMCFNLMQEQVISNIRAVKRGIKRCLRCHRCKNNDFD